MPLWFLKVKRSMRRRNHDHVTTDIPPSWPDFFSYDDPNFGEIHGSMIGQKIKIVH